jgi:hypothetical protein
MLSGDGMKQRVFIASSSEGIKFAAAAEQLLAGELGGIADVRRWDQGIFALSKSYIESLEREIEKADFAVVILTRDDVGHIRGSKRAIPRDNAIFELGLFVAALGRDRTFYIHEEDVKIPTDLMGVESPRFKRTQNCLLALSPACTTLAEAVRQAVKEFPPRIKRTPLQREIQKNTRRFCCDIEGAWWELISLKTKPESLGFFTVVPDDNNSVSFEGKAYDCSNGSLVAEWRSLAAHVDTRTITYARECIHSQPGVTTAPLPGFAEMRFEPPPPGDRIQLGSGSFWQNDHQNPWQSVLKQVKLRRVRNAKHARIMARASYAEKANVVREVLDPKSRIF